MTTSGILAAAAAAGAVAIAATAPSRPRARRIRSSVAAWGDPAASPTSEGPRPSWITSRVTGWVTGWVTTRIGRLAERALHNAAIDIDAERWLRGWAIALAASGMATAIMSVSPLVPLVVAAGPPIALGTLRHRRAARRRRHLPIALDGVASSLRSGRSIAAAMAAAGDGTIDDGPLVEELAGIAARAGAGRPLAEVIAEWSRSTDPETRLTGAALATAAELGGPSAVALETTAQSLRDRAASDGVVDALSVQARLSAWLLTVAPLAFAAVMSGIDPETGRFLFGTSAGWLCIGAGLTLDLAGGWWMHRMVRRAR